jgi:hypothetical protein
MEKEFQVLKAEIVKMILDVMETIEHTDDKDAKERFVENFEHIRDVVGEAIEDVECILNLGRRLSESQSLSSKESTLIEVFLYLLRAEGVVCNALNFISYLLVALDHDLYSTKRGYVKGDMEKIRKVEMSAKISFLNKHGFGLLTKEYDSTLRNDIAHHNFKVDNKGVLWVRGQRVKLSSKMGALNNILDFITEAIAEANERM